MYIDNVFCTLHFFYLNIFLFTCSNDVGFFWHLTDLHVDLNYSTRPGQECNGSYGDYRCDSSPSLVLSAINVTRQLSGTNTLPDFVIWSGDNGPHISTLSEHELLTGLRLISGQFQLVFPIDQVYILPVIGNHDVAPSNSMQPTPSDSKRLEWCHQLASDIGLWGPWITPNNTHRAVRMGAAGHSSALSAPPFANFSRGCFYSHLLHLPRSDLLLISLNGLVWYTGNPQASDLLPDPLGQFKWLEQSFRWARGTGTKVLLVSHFPPGASENSPMHVRHHRPRFNRQLVHLMRKYSDVLMAGLFAHTHVDSFRVLSDEMGKPAASLFILPSVSPLHLSGLGSFNPRIRQFQYDRSSGKLLGYRQYFLNLSLPQTLDSPDSLWQLEYDTADEYQLTDLSPTSLAALLDVFEQDDLPNGVWSRYWNHELGGQTHDPIPGVLTPDGLCPHTNSQCRCQHLCAMRYLDFDRLDLCLTRCPPDSSLVSNDLLNTALNPIAVPSIFNMSEITESSNTSSDQHSSLPIVAGVIIAFLAILVGVVLIVNREICRNRRRYARRFVDVGENVGDVVFTTINGSSVLRNGGSGFLPVDGMDQGIHTGSSRTELRADFHPSHRMGDDKLSSTMDAPDQSDIPDDKLGTYLLPPNVNSSYKCLRHTDQLALHTADGHLFPGNHNWNGSIPNTSSDPRFSYFIPHTSEVRDTDPNLSADCTAKDDESTPGRLGVYSFVCPSEDYYADDEAFGDEDDAAQQIDERGSLSAVEDDELSHDDSQSFHLDEGRVPLTKLKSQNRDWRLMRKRGKGSIQSVGDPVYPCRMSVSTTVGQSLPSLNCGHSITNGLQVSPSDLAPNSHSADAEVSPTNYKSSGSHPTDYGVRPAGAAIVNGGHIKCLTNESPSYDYVRI